MIDAGLVRCFQFRRFTERYFRVVMDVAPGLDEEKAAHRFAGAFLMPADALWAEIGKHRTSIGGSELRYLKL